MSFSSEAGLSKPSDVDHRCWLWVATILSITYSVRFLGARIVGKYGLLWYDDAVLGFTYLIACGHWGLLMRAVSDGLGVALMTVGWSKKQGMISTARELSDEMQGVPLIKHKLLFASELSWFAALYGAKAALLVFNMKIFVGITRRRDLTYSIAGLALLICMAASMGVALGGCATQKLLDFSTSDRCLGSTARMIAVCLLDVFSEVLMFTLPITFLHALRISGDKKRVVITLYSCRFLTTAFFIAQTIAHVRLGQEDRASIGSVPVLILQEVTLCTSLITSTIPCLRSFVGAFSQGATYWGASVHRNEIALGSIKTGARRGYTNSKSADDFGMRPDTMRHGVSIGHSRADQVSLASAESQQMIIRRETQVDVSSIHVRDS